MRGWTATLLTARQSGCSVGQAPWERKNARAAFSRELPVPSLVSATASAQGGIGNDTSGRSTTRIRLSRFVWIISLRRSLRHTERTHEELSVGMNRYVCGMCVRHCRMHCSAVHCPRCECFAACMVHACMRRQDCSSDVLSGRATHAVCSSFAMRSRQHIVSFVFVRTGPRKSATGSRGYGASGIGDRTGSEQRKKAGSALNPRSRLFMHACNCFPNFVRRWRQSRGPFGGQSYFFLGGGAQEGRVEWECRAGISSVCICLCAPKTQTTRRHV